MTIARGLAAGVTLVALCAAPVWAQSQQPTVGVEAGFNFSRISPPSTGQSVGMSPGFLAGVYTVIPFLKMLSIQAELVYVQKNTELTSTGRTSDLKLDYIEIPILAKLPLVKGIYILEGAAFDFPVRARLRPSSGAEQDIKSQVTSPDVGMVIGGGFPIQKFGIEGRYEGGFRKISTVSGADVQRTRSFSGLVRVHF